MTNTDKARSQTGHGINFWFAGAGLFSLATIWLHVVGGTPEIMDPLHGSDAPVMSRAIADVMWHHVTAVLLIAGLAMLAAGFAPGWRWPVAVLVGAQYLAISAIFLVYGQLWFASPWPMPQWVLFSAMAGLMGLGLWRDPGRVAG